MMEGYPGLNKLLSQCGRLIIVTGTCGKSTTTHLLAQILHRSGRPTVRNRDGSNICSWVFKTLAGAGDLRKKDAVIEFDEDSLVKVGIPAPCLVVVTNLSEDQFVRRRSPKELADRLARVFSAAHPQARFVANADDPLVMAAMAGVMGRTAFFGRSPLASTRLTDLSLRGTGGLTADMSVGGRHFRVSTPLPGEHNALNVLAAVAAAADLRVPSDSILVAVADARKMPGRSEAGTAFCRRVFWSMVQNPSGFASVLDMIHTSDPEPPLAWLVDNSSPEFRKGHWAGRVGLGRLRGRKSPVWLAGNNADLAARNLQRHGIPFRLVSLRDLEAGVRAAAEATPHGRVLQVLMSYNAMMRVFIRIGKNLDPGPP